MIGLVRLSQVCRPGLYTDNVDHTDDYSHTDHIDHADLTDHTNHTDHISHTDQTDYTDHTDYTNHIDHTKSTDGTDHSDHIDPTDQTEHCSMSKLFQADQIFRRAHIAFSLKLPSTDLATHSPSRDARDARAYKNLAGQKSKKGIEEKG